MKFKLNVLEITFTDPYDNYIVAVLFTKNKALRNEEAQAILGHHYGLTSEEVTIISQKSLASFETKGRFIL